MTFLALDAQKSLFTLQKNQLQFEQTIILNRVNWCTSEMRSVQDDIDAQNEADGGDRDVSENTYYKELEQMEEQLETRKSTLDDQIQALTQEISSTESLVKTNIKSSCGLNLIGS